uniref:LIM/homeobox protein Lhx9 n=1 Tax=Panagrellus redivivus TaxID=6233 RepID=A0A7E4UM44_PANRE
MPAVLSGLLFPQKHASFMDSSLAMLDDTSYPLLALSQSLTTNYEMLDAVNAMSTVMTLPQIPSFTSIPSTSTTTYGFSTPPTSFTESTPEDGNNNICMENYAHCGRGQPPLNGCSACGHEIRSKMFCVVSGNSYHEGCLKCFECGINLETKCFIKDGLMFCRDHRRSSRSCIRCLAPVKPQQPIMHKAGHSLFHLSCFTCIICGEMLRSGDKYGTGPNGALFCFLHMYPPSALQSPNEIMSNLTLNAPPPPKPDNEPITNPQPVRRPTRSVSKSDSQDEDRDSSPERGGRGQKTKRMRTSFKHHQLREMKRYFQLNHNPDAKDLKSLAQKTGLTKRVLQVWFQNARAKFRRSQASNPNMSPNGCILNQVKLEQCYPTSISGASAGSPHESLSPFDCAQTTNSSFSRSISPDASPTSSQLDGATHTNAIL